MFDLCSLQSLYQKQIEDSSHFEHAVNQFFETQSSFSKDIVEECIWREPLLSEDKLIENWKQLLAMNILCTLAQSHQSEIAAKVRLFERHPWNQSSQYFRVLVALNHAFAKMPIPEVGPILLESGAALIDLKEYSPWLSLPFTPHHFEFGIFLSLLALMTKRQDLEEVVLRIAHWQLNTLDALGKPLTALFVREKDGKVLHHLSVSYLLFRCAAILSDETLYAGASEAALKAIQQRVCQESEKIYPLWPLIEKWLEPYQRSLNTSFSLPEHIYDPSAALVGYRTVGQHVMCTLHGAHTGLGFFRLGEIEIVNYGPQYLPLGECQGFGIEGNARTDQGMRRSTIEWKRHSFSVNGCTRLVDQPSHLPFEVGKFRGIWLEVSQEFIKPHFYLKANFLGLDGWESVAFSFFVKAGLCKLQSQQSLFPRTLERYEGEVQAVTFKNQASVLELRSLSFQGRMQVIPLSGGNHFWGADFLVAYFLSPDQRHYQWHVGPP
jgi:hypothetical protein